ncbi:sigma factor [Streptomyces qinzhouensis]|uniref:sigma factor n=1 Tax=Streptomyces qinzhouensis TaxID=2599401 RepID=UPI0016468B7D|nr:sigma factor [Streptomyces qinzhouensis]
MTQLTHAQIADAKNNDISAITCVIQEIEQLIVARARRIAPTSGHTDTDLVEDLQQVGRIAVWESIATFEGDDPAQFMAYMDRKITRAMEDARRDATRTGVSVYTAKRFEKAICLAVGDPYEAERIAASEERGDEKLTPELARAARLSWMGVDSLDRPFDSARHGDNFTLGDVVAQEIGVPAELVDSHDIENHRRRVMRDQVHKVLGLLSERQRHALKAAHGITPVPQYQPGADDDELAADMGVTCDQVQKARYRGSLRFAELYRAGARAW